MLTRAKVIVQNSSVTIFKMLGSMPLNFFRMGSCQSATRPISYRRPVMKTIFSVFLVPVTANIIHGL